MKTSESIVKIAPALLKAQRAIAPARKDKTNPLYKSKYADLSAVFAACLDALNDHGLVLMQTPVHSEDGKVHMATRLQHESGEFMEETFSIPAAKQDAHGYGSACTYLRRFSVSAWLGIVTEEDDDGNEAAGKANGSKPASAGMEKHTAKQVAVDALESFPPEEQAFLHAESVKLIDMHEAGGDLYGYIHQQNYDNEEKLALWALLPSKVRSEYKRQQRAAETATQP